VNIKRRAVGALSWDGCTDLTVASASTISAAPRALQLLLFRRPPDPVHGRADAGGEAEPAA